MKEPEGFHFISFGKLVSAKLTPCECLWSKDVYFYVHVASVAEGEE
jgi:hypothetical protein